MQEIQTLFYMDPVQSVFAEQFFPAAAAAILSNTYACEQKPDLVGRFGKCPKPP